MVFKLVIIYSVLDVLTLVVLTQKYSGQPRSIQFLMIPGSWHRQLGSHGFDCVSSVVHCLPRKTISNTYAIWLVRNVIKYKYNLMFSHKNPACQGLISQHLWATAVAVGWALVPGFIHYVSALPHESKITCLVCKSGSSKHTSDHFMCVEILVAAELQWRCMSVVVSQIINN